MIFTFKEDNMRFYDLTVMNADNEEVSMKDFEGKVVLVVNTATGCGFTPQYKDLEEIYEKYHELAHGKKNVLFGGRLGLYKYFDMDKVIRASLDAAAEELNK